MRAGDQGEQLGEDRPGGQVEQLGYVVGGEAEIQPPATVGAFPGVEDPAARAMVVSASTLAATWPGRAWLVR